MVSTAMHISSHLTKGTQIFPRYQTESHDCCTYNSFRIFARKHMVSSTLDSPANIFRLLNTVSLHYTHDSFVQRIEIFVWSTWRMFSEVGFQDLPNTTNFFLSRLSNCRIVETGDFRLISLDHLSSFIDNTRY